MPISDATLEAAIRPGGTLDELGPEFDALGPRYSGKVRENFSGIGEHAGERWIIVTDRISAFDVVLGTIPFKGQVLNRLAAWWFQQTQHAFANHLLDVPDPQATRAVECTPIPVEFVVRAHLTGVTSTSIWYAYERGVRNFCGHVLPEGMRKHQRLERAILTPSTKAPKGGHDESVSSEEIVTRGLLSREEFDQLEARCLALFALGQEIAAKRGLILVDTKYELGRRPDGTVVLIDEIHTPDSSRYWYLDSFEAAMAAGEDPKSLDKEFVRRWLASVGFLGDGPPPPLPDDVRMEAARRYVATYELLTGEAFEADLEPPVSRLRRRLLRG
jgi:phosphoribosylaminoimidazole-succinocarboxamide synthase